MTAAEEEGEGGREDQGKGKVEKEEWKGGGHL